VIGCIHKWDVVCDDYDDSTEDYCEAGAGCLHRPIGEGTGEDGY